MTTHDWLFVASIVVAIIVATPLLGSYMAKAFGDGPAPGDRVFNPVERVIYRIVWGPEYGSETNYLRVHVAHIRRKLEPDPSRPRYFITEPGMGYRFEMATVARPGPD